MSDSNAFLEDYAAALRDYLETTGEDALEHAYRLGRVAVERGTSVLDLAAVHHEALASVLLRVLTPDGAVRATQRAGEFLAESLSAFEMALRGFREANAALRELNDTLEQRVSARTAELEARSEETRAVTQQLWQAAKLATMGELAASVAHELNNPLATVSLRAELLLAQASEGSPQHQALAVISQETDRMGNLVRGLLELSRQRAPQVSSLDVREEIDGTLELVVYHLRRSGTKVVRDYAAAVPLILADRQQLRQLLLNLVTNAGDAMPQGGTLTLRVTPERGADLLKGGDAPARGAGGWVVVEIGDTGVGIAAADQQHVFEPFYTTKPEGKGTGLGLAICRRIAEAHRGSIELSSEAGVGTTVRVRLPSVGANNNRSLTEP